MTGGRTTPRRPALAVLLLAPVLGEGLSSATPPLELLLPWNLALFVALYGCGALLCREVARRHGLGLAGLALLAAAYAVYEEALVDRFWFTPRHWHDTGVDDYSAVWRTNLLLAGHLTVFHVVVSIGASVLLVEHAFPERRETAWAGPKGLTVASLALFVLVPLLYGEYDLRPLPQLIAAAALAVAVVALALRLPRPRSLWSPVAPDPRPPRRLLGLVAFLAAGSHFVLVYAVASTGLPWPAGVALAFAPVVAGVVAVRAWARGPVLGPDGLRVVVGVLAFFALLCIAVGLAGRYDTTVLGLLAAVGLWRLSRGAGARGW